MEKKRNLWKRPTDKPSRLYLGKNGNFVFGIVKNSIQSRNDDFTNQNIYITSDEEIKEGDCFLPQGHINPHKLKEYNKINGDLESYNGLCYDISKCKKIILTTDQYLIKDGVQAIDDEFLEWFVKNSSCESVEVEPYHIIPAYLMWNEKPLVGYKIIIPKEEPKKYSQDDYFNDEFGKKEEPKQFVECKCTNAIQAENCIRNCGHGEEPKQETLEEVAEKYANNWEEIHPELDPEDMTPIEISKIDFIEGAKLQQERSYSDMEEYADYCLMCSAEKTLKIPVPPKEWFNQFKKK